MLGVTLETSLLPIQIVTSCIPPRCPYIHSPDFYRMLRNKEPIYILLDINAKQELLGHNDRNIKGELLAKFINRGHARHLGSQFSIFLTSRGPYRWKIFFYYYTFLCNYAYNNYCTE